MFYRVGTHQRQCHLRKSLWVDIIDDDDGVDDLTAQRLNGMGAMGELLHQLLQQCCSARCESQG